MNAIKIFVLVLISTFTLQNSYAQAPVKKEKFEVNGNCGMCKRKIEASAKAAGALSANWNMETKNLNVSFNPSATNLVKIQESIARSGYDTRDFQASDSAYNSLEECCQYERKKIITNKNN